MRVYSGKVRLAGNVYHEVPKTGMTAAEVILLQHIHGDDALVALKPEGNLSCKDAFERNRLQEIYGEDKVKTVFGISSLPLPQELSGFEDEAEDTKAEAPEAVTFKRPRRQADPTDILS